MIKDDGVFCDSCETPVLNDDLFELKNRTYHWECFLRGETKCHHTR